MKFIITLAFILSTTLVTNAQDTVYFAKNNPSGLIKKKYKGSSETNIIKIAPVSFLSGYIPVYYERELTDYLSIQLGAGITGRNYLKGWVNNFEFNDGSNAVTTYKDPRLNGAENFYSENDYTNRTTSIGTYFSIQPRIYFASEGLGGAFIGFSLDKYNYKSSSDRIIAGSFDMNGRPIFSNEQFSEYEKLTEFAAQFGSQTLYDRISVEYTTGFALRKRDALKYAFANSGNGYIEGSSSLKETKPAFTIGIKIGYHF